MPGVRNSTSSAASSTTRPGARGPARRAASNRTELRNASAIGRESLPVVLGGGHEVAWGSFQGIVRACSDRERILIVNFDAHFDLRDPAHVHSSGTPFAQIAEANGVDSAKVVSKGETIALDEDDAAAIVVRRLVEQHPYFVPDDRRRVQSGASCYCRS